MCTSGSPWHRISIESWTVLSRWMESLQLILFQGRSKKRFSLCSFADLSPKPSVSTPCLNIRWPKLSKAFEYRGTADSWSGIFPFLYPSLFCVLLQMPRSEPAVGFYSQRLATFYAKKADRKKMKKGTGQLNVFPWRFITSYWQQQIFSFILFHKCPSFATLSWSFPGSGKTNLPKKLLPSSNF